MLGQKQDEVIGINAVIGNDGRLLVVVEWADGTSRTFDRDEAVVHALAMLNAASHLYQTAAEFSRTVEHARSQIFPMQVSQSLQ
jgi:hypothetical protein